MRIILWAITAALLLGMAYHALSAPHPYTERPSFRPQTAREAIQIKPRCMRPRMFILARRLPDGRAVPVMTIVALVPCGK